jgi:hypothetical protein
MMPSAVGRRNAQSELQNALQGDGWKKEGILGEWTEICGRWRSKALALSRWQNGKEAE